MILFRTLKDKLLLKPPRKSTACSSSWSSSTSDWGQSLCWPSTSRVSSSFFNQSLLSTTTPLTELWTSCRSKSRDCSRDCLRRQSRSSPRPSSSAISWRTKTLSAGGSRSLGSSFSTKNRSKSTLTSWIMFSYYRRATQASLWNWTLFCPKPSLLWRTVRTRRLSEGEPPIR